jgi:hypothetical protein
VLEVFSILGKAINRRNKNVDSKKEMQMIKKKTMRRKKVMMKKTRKMMKIMRVRRMKIAKMRSRRNSCRQITILVVGISRLLR